MKTHLELAKLFTNNLCWTTGGEDTQYLFLKVGEENILLFAPSNSKIDWLNNFRFWKKPYKRMKTKFYVHGGFLKCWKLVRDEIAKFVEEEKMTNLTIAGWSYGGALAVLCSEDLWFRFPELKTNTITFGAPRVISIFGFKKIKHRFKNLSQYKNGADIVTTLPFFWMGFKHTSKLIKIGDRARIFGYFNPKKYHDMTPVGGGGYLDSLKD